VTNFEVSFHWNQDLESAVVVLGVVKAKIAVAASGISEVFAFAEPIVICVLLVIVLVRVEVVLAFLIFGTEVVGLDVVVLVGWVIEMIVGGKWRVDLIVVDIVREETVSSRVGRNFGCVEDVVVIEGDDTVVGDDFADVGIGLDAGGWVDLERDVDFEAFLRV